MHIRSSGGDVVDQWGHHRGLVGYLHVLWGPQDSFDSLYALMAVFGYLNAVSKDEERFEVSVPNQEVMAIMDEKMNGLYLR